MNDFREALAKFREVLHEEGGRGPAPGLRAMLERAQSARRRKMLAATAVVALFAVAIPVSERVRQQRRQREAAQARADAMLLEQVDAGLTRQVPRALAPLTFSAK